MENPQASQQKPTQANAAPATENKSENDPYTYYPVQLDSETNEDFEKTKADVEAKFAELLASLSEETVQLSEYLIEEKRLIQELCTLLRGTLRRLNMNFEIPVKAVPKTPSETRKIFLNNEAHLIFMYNDEKVSSKGLEDYPPQIVLAIIWNIIPKLEKSVRTHREKISQRVTIFEKLMKELKNLQRVFSPSEQKQDIFVVGNKELASPISESAKEETS